MYIPVHRYKLKDGCRPDQVHCWLTPDHEISLRTEWGDRFPKEQTWYDEDFDIRCFIVLDEVFGQPFYPFYDWIDESADMPQTNYQKELVKCYNQFMDGIDWLERIQ